MVLGKPKKAAAGAPSRPVDSKHGARKRDCAGRAASTTASDPPLFIALTRRLSRAVDIPGTQHYFCCNGQSKALTCCTATLSPRNMTPSCSSASAVRMPARGADRGNAADVLLMPAAAPPQNPAGETRLAAARKQIDDMPACRR